MKPVPILSIHHIVCVGCAAIERLPAPSGWRMVKEGWQCGKCARPLMPAVPHQVQPESRLDPYFVAQLAAVGTVCIVVLAVVSLVAYAWLR